MSIVLILWSHLSIYNVWTVCSWELIKCFGIFYGNQKYILFFKKSEKNQNNLLPRPDLTMEVNKRFQITWENGKMDPFAHYSHLRHIFLEFDKFFFCTDFFSWIKVSKLLILAIVCFFSWINVVYKLLILSIVCF